ncbi:hypothetical protein ACNKHP_16285 [Shigella boydii]
MKASAYWLMVTKYRFPSRNLGGAELLIPMAGLINEEDDWRI